MRKPISNDKNLIEVFGIVSAETDLAIKVDCGTGIIWIPKSQLEDWPNINKSGEILMQEWIAKEKGII